MKVEDIDWPEDVTHEQREAIVWFFNKTNDERQRHNRCFFRWTFIGALSTTLIILLVAALVSA